MKTDRSGGGKILLLGACLMLLPGTGGERSHAQVTGESAILYQSPGLRIVRAFDRQGHPILLLTNLDEDGNRLLPQEDTPAPVCAPEPAGSTAEATPAPSGPPVETDRTPIVVINIENQAPPAEPPAAEAPPWVLPVVAFGGLPGPFRYPRHQPFLGYGSGIASPSWLGGLGLNAGNGFGLKGGRGCGDGYDCMFAPSSHP